MTAVPLITVLVAEDHAVVRQGIMALLNADGRFAMVGGARTGRDAVEMARNLRPDVILMDIAMPELNGLEATRQIIAAWPDARVMILSAYSDIGYIDRTLVSGALGFLEKQASADSLVAAVLEIAAGRPHFGQGVAKRLRALSAVFNRQGLPSGVRIRLTSREAEVLQLVAEGSANKQVAAALGISIKTVEKHRQQVMDKLDIHETAGLTRYAIAAGLIENSDQPTAEYQASRPDRGRRRSKARL